MDLKPNNPLKPLVEYVANLEVAHDADVASLAQNQKQIASLQQQNTALEQQSNLLQQQVNDLLAKQPAQCKVQRVIGVGLAALERRYPYHFGGEMTDNPPDPDCSALVQYCFQVGAEVKLPRVSRNQAEKGREIAEPDLLPGDALFFDTNHDGTINHTGIYIGDGNMLHTANKQEGIAIIDWKDRYKEFVTARRYIE